MSSSMPVASSVLSTTSLPSTSSTMRPPLACRALAAAISARMPIDDRNVTCESSTITPRFADAASEASSSAISSLPTVSRRPDREMCRTSLLTSS
jgi:hypothetical protein